MHILAYIWIFLGIVMYVTTVPKVARIAESSELPWALTKLLIANAIVFFIPGGFLIALF